MTQEIHSDDLTILLGDVKAFLMLLSYTSNISTWHKSELQLKDRLQKVQMYTNYMVSIYWKFQRAKMLKKNL